MGGALSPASPSCRRRCWGETAPAGPRVTPAAPPNRRRREGRHLFLPARRRKENNRPNQSSCSFRNWFVLMNGGRLTCVTSPVTCPDAFISGDSILVITCRGGAPSYPRVSGMQQHHLTHTAAVSHAVSQSTSRSVTPPK